MTHNLFMLVSRSMVRKAISIQGALGQRES
jgi:hypothetical protein